MTPNLTLCVLVGTLSAVGAYLLLARSIVRALLGLLLLGNAANVLFLVASGPAGRPPLVGVSAAADMSDPLPQAMVLTAIVITLGMTAFLLALAHRSWQLGRSDVLEDDPEDARILALAKADEPVDSDVDAGRISDEELALDPEPDPEPGLEPDPRPQVVSPGELEVPQ